MNDINIKKDNIRKEYLNIRKNTRNKLIKSNIITNKLINTLDYLNANTIAIYKNLDSEVNTSDLIDYSLNIGKEVLLPKVIDDDLYFYKYNKEDILIKSNFGILEPTAKINNLVDINNIDLIIIPGICFDKYKNRLGFGKGYYDRYLMNSNIKKIAICFEEQILKNDIIPTNKYDIKMDIIITNKNIY